MKKFSCTHTPHHPLAPIRLSDMTKNCRCINFLHTERQAISCVQWSVIFTQSDINSSLCPSPIYTFLLLDFLFLRSVKRKVQHPHQGKTTPKLFSSSFLSKATSFDPSPPALLASYGQSRRLHMNPKRLTPFWSNVMRCNTYIHRQDWTANEKLQILKPMVPPKRATPDNQIVKCGNLITGSSDF